MKWIINVGIVSLLAAMVGTSVSAQQTLFLGNPGKNRHMYFVGDPITVVLQNKTKVSGRITFLTENKIGIQRQSIDIDSVKKVIIPNHYLRFRRMGIQLIGSTISMLILDVLNRRINRGDPAFDAQNLGVSTVLASLGCVLLPWNNKVMRVSNRRPLKVVDFD